MVVRAQGTTTMTLAVAGAADPTTPPASLRAVARGSGTAASRAWGAHLVDAVRAAEVNQLLLAHLAEVTPTPRTA